MSDASFKTDWTQRNWFPILLGKQHICDFWFQHDHDPDLKSAFPEVREWLAANCRYRWEMQFGKGYERGSLTHHCRVIFRAKADAALFKMIWT